MAFHRAQLGTLNTRLRETPELIIAVFGPRQTGKTVMVREALRRSDAVSRYLAVDEPDPTGLSVSNAIDATVDTQETRDTQWLVRNWERARLDAERSPGGGVLAIDEVHKIPGWSDTVKGLWDADRARRCPLHVVILGSAPLLMQSGLSESLMGRFEPIRVAHWSFAEMAAAFGFDLPTYLYFGESASSRIRGQPVGRGPGDGLGGIHPQQ